jgi:hypothetical protein
MSLEQSVVWLRNTLLGHGKFRLALNATYVCDSENTGVGLDRGILTIDVSATCTEGSRRYTQKLKYEIRIADVDARKLSVVEMDDPKSVTGFNVHIVMAEGKKARRKQVLIENGETTRKEFEYSDNEFHLNDKEKAYQTVAVLRRIVMLSSPKTSGKQPGGAAGSGTAEVRQRRTLTESFDKRVWWRTQTA